VWAARTSTFRTTTSFFDFQGLSVTGAPEHVHFARRLDVVVWGAERVW
jgi:hypothetical protein